MAKTNTQKKLSKLSKRGERDFTLSRQITPEYAKQRSTKTKQDRIKSLHNKHKGKSFEACQYIGNKSNKQKEDIDMTKRKGVNNDIINQWRNIIDPEERCVRCNRGFKIATQKFYDKENKTYCENCYKSTQQEVK